MSSNTTPASVISASIDLVREERKKFGSADLYDNFHALVSTD